jgi:hypothetical protein
MPVVGFASVGAVGGGLCGRVPGRHRGEVRILDPQLIAGGRCGGHVAVHGRDKYLTLLACGGVALGSQ